MKHKRITAAVLTVMLLLSGTGAYAEILPNFSHVNSYDEYTYIDVSTGDWFYYYVGFVYEYGIMTGTSDGFFEPGGHITLAEAITVAARLNAVYYNNKINTNIRAQSPEVSWFIPYLSYAAEQGIVAPTEFNNRYFQPATRAEFAHIVHKAIPGCFEKINDISPIPDLPTGNSYYFEILSMYEAGVLSGSDEYGTFYPDSYVKRSEAAAMTARVVNTELRKHFSLNQNRPYASFSYTWRYPYTGRTFSMNIDISYYDYKYFASKPRSSDYSAYARDVADETAVYTVANALRSLAVENGFSSEYDIVGFVSAFVQSLEYQDDMVFKGVKEYPKYPIETLFEQGGDCEDTAVLLAKMLKLLDFGAVLLVSRDHMAVGVQTSGQGNVSYGGVNYFYIETTEPGWTVGDVPSDMVGESMEIVYI